MKDLFGNELKECIDAATQELMDYDGGSFNERLSRLKYINKKFPFGQREYGSDESYRIFNEALHCFIFGQYVSTIILSQAFIERRFQEYFHLRMDEKRSKYSLDKLLKEFRINGFIDIYFIEKIDRIRLKRNPFVHHRELLHKDSLMSRACSLDMRADELIENDAKDALSVMLTMSQMRIL